MSGVTDVSVDSPCFEDLTLVDVFVNYDFFQWCVFWVVTWYLLQHATREYFYPRFHGTIFDSVQRQVATLTKSEPDKKSEDDDDTDHDSFRLDLVQANLETVYPDYDENAGFANAIYSLIHIWIILVLDGWLLFYKNNRYENGDRGDLWSAMENVYQCGDLERCKRELDCDGWDVTALNKTMAYFLIDYICYVYVTNHRFEYMVHHFMVAALAMIIRYCGAGYPCLQYGLLTSEFGTMTLQIAWLVRDMNKYYKKKAEVVSEILITQTKDKSQEPPREGETRGRRASVVDNSGCFEKPEEEKEKQSELKITQEELTALLRKDKVAIFLEKWEFFQSLVFSLTFFVVRLFLVPLMCFKVCYYVVFENDTFPMWAKVIQVGGLLLLAAMGFWWSRLLAKRLYRMVSTKSTDSDRLNENDKKAGGKVRVKDY